MPHLRPFAPLALAPLLLAGPSCDALRDEVLRQTSLMEARFVPAEVGAGVAMALVQLRDYQGRTAAIAAHWPDVSGEGCVIPEMEQVSPTVQRFTFNHYSCEGRKGYVHATVETTVAGGSVRLEYEDYVEEGVSVAGALELVDEGSAGRVLLDFSTHYDGMGADIEADGAWADLEEGGLRVDAEGVLGSAAGLAWTFSGSGLELREGCAGISAGSLSAGWEDRTTVRTDFPDGECSECYTVSIDGGDTEDFCPSEWLG
ncbi:hypothetical protein L6R50_18160 [Myxococcota bacterium]|nr:hypothetical protein [Myxococcota bacterium]